MKWWRLQHLESTQSNLQLRIVVHCNWSTSERFVKSVVWTTWKQIYAESWTNIKNSVTKYANNLAVSKIVRNIICYLDLCLVNYLLVVIVLKQRNCKRQRFIKQTRTFISFSHHTASLMQMTGVVHLRQNKQLAQMFCKIRSCDL